MIACATVAATAKTQEALIQNFGCITIGIENQKFTRGVALRRNGNVHGVVIFVVSVEIIAQHHRERGQGFHRNVVSEAKAFLVSQAERSINKGSAAVPGLNGDRGIGSAAVRTDKTVFIELEVATHAVGKVELGKGSSRDIFNGHGVGEHISHFHAAAARIGHGLSHLHAICHGGGIGIFKGQTFFSFQAFGGRRGVIFIHAQSRQKGLCTGCLTEIIGEYA